MEENYCVTMLYITVLAMFVAPTIIIGFLLKKRKTDDIRMKDLMNHCIKASIPFLFAWFCIAGDFVYKCYDSGKYHSFT
jgi:dolichyl-phosphate-mannose--protein O-mannosyl transferase